MADLSTLSETAPADTDLVSAGAGNIRDTRLSTKTSVALEHALSGEHKFPQGDTASRVAYTLGRLYLNTQQRQFNQGIAGSWFVAPNAQFQVFTDPTPAGEFSLTSTYQNVNAVSITPASGSFVLAISVVQVKYYSLGIAKLGIRTQLDGATIPPSDYVDTYIVPSDAGLALPISRMLVVPAIAATGFGLSESSHTFACQMREESGSTDMNIRSRFIGVIAL